MKKQALVKGPKREELIEAMSHETWMTTTMISEIVIVSPQAISRRMHQSKKYPKANCTSARQAKGSIIHQCLRSGIGTIFERRKNKNNKWEYRLIKKPIEQ